MIINILIDEIDCNNLFKDYGFKSHKKDLPINYKKTIFESVIDTFQSNINIIKIGVNDYPLIKISINYIIEICFDEFISKYQNNNVITKYLEYYHNEECKNIITNIDINHKVFNILTPQDYFFYIENISKWSPKFYNLENFIRGWIIGNFEPNLYKTNNFEISVQTHKENEIHPFHIHETLEEINIIIEGKMIFNGKELSLNDIFVSPKGTLSCCKFLSDCKIICIKIPSNPLDKIII